MEKNLLVRLILDDVKILEKLISSFNENIDNPEEIEIALNRSRAVTKELELLSKNIMPAPGYVEGKTKFHEQSLSEKKIDKVENPEFKEKIPDKSIDEKNNESQIEREGHLKPAHSEKTTSEKNNENKGLSGIKTYGIIDEEAIQNSQLKTLGESLGGNKQVVNDLLGINSDDSSLIGSPLKNIRDGIGINDRFLYIRELFDNDNSKYEEVIRTIDKYTSINDAVDFLKTNFNWSKSDSSDKFLSLIKRKFRNTNV